MFDKKKTCPRCDHEFKAKDAKFCPACGTPVVQGHADIVVIVDRSGSMQSCHKATVDGFNRFLSDQKALPGTATMTVVQFDNEYKVLIDRKPLGEIAPVGMDAFTPRGGTALFDAIGRSMAMMEAMAGVGTAVVCIITDGQENQSRECTQQQVRDLIRRLESKGWAFVYLGANQDAFAVGHAMGMANAASYNATPGGTDAVYAAMSSNVRSFRVGGQSLMCADFGNNVKGLAEAK